MYKDLPRSQRALFKTLIALAVSALLIGFLVTQVSGESECAPSNLRTANWSTDFCQSVVNFDEILVGNPVKNGIPAVTDPALESVAAAADWLSERSPVIAVELDKEARAYPLAILMWHEIANDVIGDTPVAVTFCPLCNSSVTFDRRVKDDVLEFGVSGLLRNSDLIMFDFETESWWQQLTGEGLAGAHAGVFLGIVPSQVVSFGSFAERHPDGLVMSRETGYNRQYGVNPYSNYDSRPGTPFLFRGEVDPRVSPPVAHVLAAEINGIPVAYPFEVLRGAGVLNDVVAETPVAVFFQGGVASALGDYIIDNARDIGGAGMYEATLDGMVLKFSANADGTFTDDATNSNWNGYGEAIDGELAGRELRWINAFPHFWFAWAAFQPDTLVYGQD